MNAWDIAAGLLIAREAGAIVDGMTRGTNPIETGDAIVANSAIFETFAQTVRGS